MAISWSCDNQFRVEYQKVLAGKKILIINNEDDSLIFKRNKHIKTVSMDSNTTFIIHDDSNYSDSFHTETDTECHQNESLVWTQNNSLIARLLIITGLLL